MTRRGVIILLVVLLLGAGAVLASIRLLATEKVIFLEIDATSSDPFTPPAVFTSDSPPPPAPIDPSVAITTPSSPEPVGDNPGPIGGTVKKGDCDPELLIQFLNDNPDRLDAWIGAAGTLAGDFEDYVRGMSPAILTRDTRVTNYGFREGKAVEIQSILANGTTVLVDENGDIAVRCHSGSPLDPPKPVDNYKCDGCPSSLGATPPCNQTCYEGQAVTPNLSSTTTTFQTPAGASTTTTSTRPVTTTRAGTTAARTPTTRRSTSTTRRTQPPVTATFNSTQPSTFPTAATQPPLTFATTQPTAPTIPPSTFPTAATQPPTQPTTTTNDDTCLPILGCI